MSKINCAIDILNYNHNISVREHLRFGSDVNLNNKLKFTALNDRKSIGEHNSDNKLHGKSIRIYLNGEIRIGYWDKGLEAPGNYINIFSDGRFHVGEIYMKDAKKWIKGTRYYTDGRTEVYD